MLMLETAWPILCGSLPAHRGYALFGALCRAGVVFHGQPDVIVLPPGRKLVIRCPEERAWRLAGSGLERLSVDGVVLSLGSPEVRPLLPSPSLESWCVTVKGKTTEGSLRAACLDQLDRMSVACQVRVKSRRILWVNQAAVVGYEVRLSGLSPESSLTVQSRGLGGRTRMGCGGFTPC